MSNGSNNGVLGFILGAAIIVLVGVVWYVATDGDPLNQRSEVTIELPEF